MEAPSWLAGITEEDLVKLLDERARKALASVREIGGTADDIGRALSTGGMACLSADGRAQVPKGTWERIQHELWVLICTKERRYGELRKRLAGEGRKAAKVIVPILAAQIGAVLGVPATAAALFVVVCLILILQIGKEVWCCSRAEASP